jgi:hypothetical protein
MIEYTMEQARYAKGMVIVRAPSFDGFKTRAAFLLTALKARWTNRERGYVCTQSKAQKFERLFAEGWDGDVLGRLVPPPKKVSS